MLKYKTILESKMFKVSKVKNTTTNKSWYSLIYNMSYNSHEVLQICSFFGDNYKYTSVGREWKFKDLNTVIKKYNWAILRWA